MQAWRVGGKKAMEHTGRSAHNLYKTWKIRKSRSLKIGIKPSWDTFEDFVAYVGDRPKHHHLVTKRSELGFTVGNVQWMLPIHGPFELKWKNRYRKRNPLYSVWKGMKRRCSNPKDKEYRNYGARGITVCDHWLDSFHAFLADIGPRPDGAQIDRINNNGNYEPGNCRWVAPEVNARNKRDTIYVWHAGMKLDLMSACQLTGRSYTAIGRRRDRSRNARTWQDCFESMYAINRDALYQKK